LIRFFEEILKALSKNCFRHGCQYESSKLIR
jgi:hypothetical protein